MSFEDAAPCRHRGAPPDDLVNQVVDFLRMKVSQDVEYLARHGLTADEYALAFSAAVERMRGSSAASNRPRREFAENIIKHLAASDQVRGYDVPRYGDDTVYRVTLTNGRQIGVIQKGCPDGAHSSTRWTRPEWADELYLWWVCSSLNMHPGEHIWKGVSRVRNKVRAEDHNQLDGFIFFNSQCGSPERPCPKAPRVAVNGADLPPPCIYVFPHWENETTDINWRGAQRRVFPAVLLSAFGIGATGAGDYVGYVGFRNTGSTVRTEITSRFGPAKATTARG